MTRPGPELATIGIVTALPKECAAMLAMLEGEEPWTPPGRNGGASDVKYYLGRIPVEVDERVAGEHVVVVALMPDMGNNVSHQRRRDDTCCGARDARRFRGGTDGRATEDHG